MNVQALTINDVNQVFYCCMSTGINTYPKDDDWERMAWEAIGYIQQTDPTMLEITDTCISTMIGIRVYAIYLKPKPKGIRVTPTGRTLSLVS